MSAGAQLSLTAIRLNCRYDVRQQRHDDRGRAPVGGGQGGALRCPSHMLRAAATPTSRPVLLITPEASPAALAAAEHAGWSVIVLNTETSAGPTGRVRLPGSDVIIGAAATDTFDGHRERPGRRSWATYVLVRELLVDGAATQHRLAQRAVVTQPRPVDTHGLSEPRSPR